MCCFHCGALAVVFQGVPDVAKRIALVQKTPCVPSHTSATANLTRGKFHPHPTTPLGWWIGCSGVGPIRRCHRECAPGTALTKQGKRTHHARRRAWARERIHDSPAPKPVGRKGQPVSLLAIKTIATYAISTGAGCQFDCKDSVLSNEV